ncbi:MAG: leucine-rich repeat domain-containing protein [Lachnospiraceae bacterium]|nr:leucine-rich repeat domain-containing protein [Lachnospiraceae bacterium]
MSGADGSEDTGGMTMELTQKEKAAQLQRAVINSAVREIAEVYDALGDVEMSAPALGLACRFRGLDVVQVLAERGATFDFPSTEEIELRYHCHIGEKHAPYRENYRTNYALYFLKCSRGGRVKGARCLQGMNFKKNEKREDGTLLPFLSDRERSAVLDYLILHQEKLAFRPEELLYYAIFARDSYLYGELKKRGIHLTQKRIHAITEGTLADGYWLEFCTLTGKLTDREYVSVMQQLSAELEGKPFRFTEKTFNNIQNRFHDIRIFAFFLEHFRREKMQPTKIMRCVIDRNLVEAMPFIEREGWLSTPKKREEMIAYAARHDRTEMLAWLLDFKNRTADFAAEQEKADKKLMRTLNAAPDSVTALGQLWRYKKTADGTLAITNYKGSATEVTVPEKIGKRVVTAIGKGAFTGEEYQYRNAKPDTMNPGATNEQIKQHRTITKIVLPDTIQVIGAGAFQCMEALLEINIPAGVKEIGGVAFCGCSLLKRIALPPSIERICTCTFLGMSAIEEICIPPTVREIEDLAFMRCASLKKITVPENVTRIGAHAFDGCAKLEEVYIGEGVEELGTGAFAACAELRTLTIPSNVKRIGAKAFLSCIALETVYISEGVEELGAGAFAKCSTLRKVYMPASIQRVQDKEENSLDFEMFAECPDVTVICPRQSKAEAYCREKGIRYQACERVEYLFEIKQKAADSI